MMPKAGSNLPDFRRIDYLTSQDAGPLGVRVDGYAGTDR